MLVNKTKARYENLQDGNNSFYYVDQETKKKTIDEEFVFNDLLRKTSANEEDELVLDLLVRIKGLPDF